MIIWNRWGFLAAVIAFACLLASEFTVEAVMRDDQYFQRFGWPKFAAFVAAAIIVWPVGRAFNRKRPERELIDAQTGERVVIESGGGNSLFFIPMEYWAPLFVAIGIVCLFVK